MMNSCFFLKSHGKWGQCWRGRPRTVEASLNLATSDERKEVQGEGRRDGCRMNRFVVGSSEEMANTEGKRKSTQIIKKMLSVMDPGRHERKWAGAKFSSAGCWSVMHSLKPKTHWIFLLICRQPFTWCLAGRIWGHVCKKKKLLKDHILL